MNLANGTERNHEPTERVSVAALEGMLDVTFALLRRLRAAMSSNFERLEARTVFEGGDLRRLRGRASATRTARRSPASGSSHPTPSAIVAYDDEHVYLVRQPREAIGGADVLELPAGTRRRGGGAARTARKRELAEEIGMEAEHWEHLTTFFTRPGFTDERVHVFLATGLRDEPGRGRGRADRDRAAAARRPRRPIADRRDAKTLIGLLLLRERLRG